MAWNTPAIMPLAKNNVIVNNTRLKTNVDLSKTNKIVL